MSRCGLLYDPVFLDHLTGPGHPECPDRVSHAYEAIKGSGLLKQCTLISTKVCQMVDLERAHSQAYLTRAQKDISGGLSQLSTGDTVVSKDSWSVARSNRRNPQHT